MYVPLAEFFSKFLRPPARTQGHFFLNREPMCLFFGKTSTILEMYNQYLLLRTYIAIFCAKVSQIEELRLVNLNEEDLTRWMKCILGVLASHCEHPRKIGRSKMAQLETVRKFLARNRLSHEKFGSLTTLVMLMSHRTLEHCSSMLEKLAARKWLGSKPLENFWLETARAMKILAL